MMNWLQTPEYDIEVIAVDSGRPQMTGTVTVKVTLTDINDNPPFFSQHNYTAVVQVSTDLIHLITTFVRAIKA